MKICSIRIRGFQQFDDLYLDFTNPETGEPVDKVCFIGRNGTGKSTILELIRSYIYSFDIASTYSGRSIFIKIKTEEKEFIYFYNNKNLEIGYYESGIERISDWHDKIINFENLEIEERQRINSYYINYEFRDALIDSLKFKINNNNIQIYSPSESYNNEYLTVSDVPKTNLNSAISLFNEYPYFHEVSDRTVEKFWRQLIFLIKQRENEREAYENLPKNLNKTKKQLIEEFDIKNPKILKKIAELWDRILNKAGLEFDYERASNPIQLNDNLKAYIKLKSTGERINYNQLSTGIRNFIFRIGHIYSLYFNREIKKGFLLVDEPENSLFPDFLYELIDIYQEITTDKNGERNTQMFFATHNPIIAAQFEPYERILLEWDDKGHVQAFKGKAPAGDDPNDVLKQDFRIDHLMGKKGQEVWQEYLDLKKQLRHTKNGKDKDELISKISKLGQLYNFED